MGKSGTEYIWRGLAIGLTAFLLYKEAKIERLRADLRRLESRSLACKAAEPTLPSAVNPAGVAHEPVAVATAAPAVTGPAAVGPGVAAPVVAAKTPQQEFAVRARLSNIEKFVPLTEDTRARLTEKFEAEVRDPNAQTEPLESIIGQEQATFYRAEVKKAFVKARDEEVEKEVLLLGRNLALSTDQQRRLREVYVNVEQQLDELYGDPEQRYRFKGTMEERMKRMMETTRYRREQLADALKGVLTPEQYEAYLKEVDGSAEGELGVWHQ